MEKLTSQIMVHLPESAERQIKGLASIEGQKSGEFVRQIIMQEVFGKPENLE